MEYTEKSKLTILLPVYNEEASLPFTYSEILHIIEDNPICTKYDWEILFVNDGSSDSSLNVIKSLRKEDKRISYISLSRNFGKENAMLAGLDYAKGDAVIIMDADLQHPPKLIPTMINSWEDGILDVYAKRANRKTDSKWRALLCKIYYKILVSSSSINILQDVGDFRLIDRKCVNALKQLRESNRFAKGLYSWIGYKKKELIYEVEERKAGKSKWNLGSLSQYAADGLTSFSTKPLRISTYLGVIVAMLSFFIGVFYFAKTLIVGEPVRGFTTLIVVISFLGGSQLFAIGVLGEYVGRIYNEVKHRPPYLVDEYNNNEN